MRRVPLISGVLLAFLAGACAGACDKGAPVDPPPAVSAAVTPPASPAGEAKAPAAKLIKTWGKPIGFKTPESVLHDESNDLYLVSNVEGKPLEKDGKAFISKVAPEAQGVELKWIEGGKNKVTLNAPKGMAFMGDALYVADIDTLRVFDRKTGAPTGEVKIPDAMFLNDVVATGDGRVLVSDTAMKNDGSGGLAPGGADAIYAIDKDKKVTTLAKAKDLDNPNGLAWVNGKLWVVTFGSTELYMLDPKGAKTEVQKLAGGTLDGVASAGTDFFVSSWETKTIYRGRIGQGFAPLITDVKSPADIAYDRNRKRIIVPLFEEDELRAYEIAAP